MDYVCPVNKLEQRLKEAGEHLAFPPSSINDLLDLLDKTEQLLTFVGQAPSMIMQGALVPSMGALISDGLIKHSEVDVRVSVASCLCEVARITAPKPPYKDEIMKDIFQLIVLAFGQLSTMTGQNYHKAVHILESVAKVRSCLLMLELECDALVLEMFKQFLSEIRVDHPHTVISDMETIMTLIIEESDEIATELLSLLISHVKKENQIITPASWKVAEKVLRNCNETLKFYSEKIMKLINSNPDDYAEVITVLCQNTHENGHAVTRSATHKRDRNTLKNGGSMKKQKYIDKNQLNGKELKTPKRGRPKKNKNILNQDNGPNLVQNSQESTRRTRFQGKKQSSNTNGDVKNSGSLYNVVIKTEDVTLSDCDGAEPLTQHKNNNTIRNRRNPSSNKRAANGSRGKDIQKKWGQDLVGCRIKVWWPMDKMYYEGVVSSYNPADDKHKVLYADGDEELLNLHNEKWMMLDGISPDQGQVANLPSPVTAPSKQLKRKGKRKIQYSVKQEDNSYSLKSPPPANSSKTADAICNANNQKNNHVLTPDTSCGVKLTKKATNDMEKNGDLNSNGKLQEKKASGSSEAKRKGKRKIQSSVKQDNFNSLKSPPPADSSKTADANCNADNQKNNLAPALDTSCGVKLTKKATNDMEKNGNLNSDGKLQEKKVSESSGVKRIGKRKIQSSVKQDNSNSLKSPPHADSSKTADANCNADNQKSNPVLTPDAFCGVKLTRNTTNGMEKNGDSNPNGELQENTVSESSEVTQRLENTDKVASET